jgi:cytochrome c oxidase subunit 2
MPPLPTLRTLATALGLALATTAWAQGAWAQDAAVTDAPADEGAAQGAEQTPGPATEPTEAPAANEATDATPDAVEDGAAPAPDNTSVEGAPPRPTDATDGAQEAAPDASGNSQDDANPRANPDEGTVTDEEAAFTGAGGRDLPVIGAPVPAGIDLQPASTGIAADLNWLDGMLNWIIAGIVLLVMALLLWVILRFNERRNPTPATFTHNSPLEIAWTVVPIVILIFIGSFSLPVLFEEQEIPEGDIYVKVTGNQWFWSYEYQNEGVTFDSYMIGYGEPPMTEAEDDPVRANLIAAGYDPSLYKLATDTAVVLPVGRTVVMNVTGADVIHSWTIPAFGVKQDAVPGRIAQLWFRPETEGVFFGQCSELCGKDHAFMPITVRVVSQDAYEAWIVEQGGTLDGDGIGDGAEGSATSASAG